MWIMQILAMKSTMMSQKEHTSIIMTFAILTFLRRSRTIINVVPPFKGGCNERPRLVFYQGVGRARARRHATWQD